MNKIHVNLKPDFIKSLARSPRPLLALVELIWNSFDAGSDKVRVFITNNKIGGIHSIIVQDDGYGIKHGDIKKLFGDLGDSWKKITGRQNGRALHGKNGQGRFKAFALGSHVEWTTTYEEFGKTYSYKITGKIDANDFDVTEPEECVTNGKTGTTVTIHNVIKNYYSLQEKKNPQHELAKIFSLYLTEYKGIQLEYDGKTINPKEVQNDQQNFLLDEVKLSDDQIIQPVLSIIEWNIETERAIHFCDEKGVALHDIPINRKIQAPGFHFTLYIKSSYFKELDSKNLLCIPEINPDVQHILDIAIEKTKAYFRKRLAEKQSEIVDNWKRENIYPYEDKESLGSIEQAERQVFDIVAVNVQDYLPSFDKSNIRAKKFMFSLLAQSLKQNSESVQTIITEVLALNKEKQDELAELLKNTNLSSIISSSKVVANRLDFLNSLEQLLFKPESKKALLERDQLHKILEKEAWIFNEEFSLAGSEQRLDEVLQIHLKNLGKREDQEIAGLGDNKAKRIDLMLHKAIQPRVGEFDYLIVELKRPSKKIDDLVISQIKKYAIAVADDERFQGIKIRWTFIAVSNELDSFAKKEANQRGKPTGQVYDDGELNITVWVKTWSEIINDARSKLLFINKQLEYKADDESAIAYLQKTHDKFIPDKEIKT